MKIILLGAPGCGKGTQAEIISKKFGITHLSSGDIFREAIKNSTPLGNLAKNYMNKGELVPDEVTIGLVTEKLTEGTKNGSLKNGFMLDGFPRTLEQAQALAKSVDIDMVLYFEISQGEVINRITKRRVCSKCNSNYIASDNLKTCTKCGGEIVKRADDNLEVALKRMEVYNNQTYPLLEYYKNLNILKTINANQPVELVSKQISVLLGEV